MKKFLLLLGFFLSTFSFAQVGLGINTPNPSAQLEVSSTIKGFLPPRMTETQRNAIPSPAAGLIIYCTNCGANGQIQVFNGTAWTNLLGESTTATSVASLDCIGATNSGFLIANTVASNVTSTIAYTGGNGGSYEALTIISTGVTGLTATLAAGTLATGNGSITYTITGTPSAEGTASFLITLGGQTCTLTIPIGA